MFSIKNSFADCSSCDLLEHPSCILETNTKADLSKVDIMFIAENPGKDEIKKEVPLIGRSGQIFRKPFNKYVKPNAKYLLTNTVLCLTLNEDGTTGNPTDETIETCKVNCFNIIEQCNPKLIVLLGTSAMKAFGIAKSGITDLRGKMFKWKDYDVLLTIHPSFANRNKTYIEKLEDDIRTAADFISEEEVSEKKEFKKVGTKGKKGIHRYKIPEKFYTDEYRLVDVQFLSQQKQVLYIFRDSQNNKVYHKESDEYVCYQALGLEARKIVPYDKLTQIHLPYKEKATLDHEITYEGDNKITIKHAMDYFHHSKGEADIVKWNIFFADIEIDVGINNKAFPNSQEAKYPVNMITMIYNKQKICYILDNKTEPIKDQPGCELKIFKSEKQLLNEFIKDFKKFDPDFASGWNFIGFDMEYLYNRFKNIGIRANSMSKFGEFYVDAFRYTCNLPGTVVVDQLYLYKMFTFTKLENYKLGTVAAKHLEGRTKLVMPHPINEMYWKALNTLIEYNIRDTDLLAELEDELSHIHLLNELKIICNTNFNAACSTFGQVDSMMVSFLKNKGLASKNGNPHIEKKKYPGAFVYEPVPGIYDNVTDFDFTSLYPSIIQTYNIGVNNFIMRFKDMTHGYDFVYNFDSLPDKVPMILDPVFKAEEVTVDKNELFKKAQKEEMVYTVNGCFFKSHKKAMSVYSEVLTQLLDGRKAYKNKMFEAKQAKDKHAIDLYFTRQLVYKVLANSLYGVIANKAFRFFDLSCAAAITLGGQESLKHSILQGDKFMKMLHKQADGDETAGVDVIPQITKKEMFGETMPDRETEYIVTGDTDSIFCCFQDFPGDKSDERIKEWCNQIQDFLNVDIIGRMVQSHNVDQEFNKLYLKNELIISRGLFLAKKRYALHVTNNEGVVVDEIDNKGLETKRSDYPSKSKAMLGELIEMILKSEKVSLPMLFKYIKRQEKEFVELIRAGDKSIARPVSYGKKIKDYKTLPQGVKAMEAFNKICYQAHSVGGKAYMYRVSGIDEQIAPKEIIERYYDFVDKVGKIVVIAIPDEEARLPEYFIPDLKGNLKFCFTDRYELLLKPLTDVKKVDNLMTI